LKIYKIEIAPSLAPAWLRPRQKGALHENNNSAKWKFFLQA
jgi:hypothetical protein